MQHQGNEPQDSDDSDPGTSPWGAMARELASNPDSPASLRIMSALNAGLRPRQEAVDALIQALIVQAVSPGPGSDAAVDAAIANWEAVCEGPMDPALLADFRAQADELRARRRRGPPSLESVVQDINGRTDVGYDHGLHLQGLKGSWHRLWAVLAMEPVFGDGPKHQQMVAEVREQFEGALGRPLSAQEFDVLRQHALAAGETIHRPDETSLPQSD